MSTARPFLPDALRSIAPWIAATLACLMAVVMLSQFIDTLHASIERGQAFRSAQYGPNTGGPTTVTRVADSGTRAQVGSR